ncbi:hypothetical protein [uncultured Psychrobacter sp.]|uniref:hypothetical protein n=1 Tax=uncultured Psychrobacter sp. TaxID=259303 RepID=UPI0030DAA985
MTEDTAIINRALINEVARLESQVKELQAELASTAKSGTYQTSDDEIRSIKDKISVGQNWLCLNPNNVYDSSAGKHQDEPPFIMKVDKVDVSLRGDMYRDHNTVRGHVTMPQNMADWVMMLPDESIKECLIRVNAEREAMLLSPKFHEPIDSLMTNLNKKSLNKVGVYTIKDLVGKNKEWLRDQDSIGAKSLRHIEAGLNERGLYFGMLKTVAVVDE